ncbi:MAG: septum formation initiator family protein [Nanoarchaeota archaeon]|nr:septum formation initiator family protein [Nanoarchaeota archaeon]
MSLWKILAAVLIILLAGAGILNLWREKRELGKGGEELKAELSGLLEENKKLKEEARYFEDEENLLKEAKSQFNYRAPDEKLIIIVPKSTSTE